MIVNSPLINGRTEPVKGCLDSPMGSPQLVQMGDGNSNSIRKKVLTRNINFDTKLKKFLPKKEEEEITEISEEKSPVDLNIKNMKKEEKPIKSMIGNSMYVASPLSKRPKGVSVPGKPKETDNVKNVLKKMEEKKK